MKDDAQIAHLHGKQETKANLVSIYEESVSVTMADSQPTLPGGAEDLTFLPGFHCVHLTRSWGGFGWLGVGGETFPSQEFCFTMLAGHHYQIHHEGKFDRCQSLDWFWITDGSDGQAVAGEPPTDAQKEFGVILLNNNLYRILRDSCTVSRSIESLKADAYADADTFCVRSGKKLKPVSSEDTSPGTWNTFVTGEGNAIELQFYCLAENDE
jgi:hypothetical protein